MNKLILGLILLTLSLTVTAKEKMTLDNQQEMVLLELYCSAAAMILEDDTLFDMHTELPTKVFGDPGVDKHIMNAYKDLAKTAADNEIGLKPYASIVYVESCMKSRLTEWNNI